MKPYPRGLFSLASLVLIGYYAWSLRPAPLIWGMLFAMWLLYQGMIWARQDWWSGSKYAVCICMAIALASAIALSDGGVIYDSVLLIPPVLLLAREQQNLQRVATILAAILMAVMLTLAHFTSFAFSLLPSVLTLYICIRAINIYKSAHRTSQIHLEALDAAHRQVQQMYAELQEASAQSMQYAALVERTRIAHEIHDSLGHQLTSLIVQIQALQLMLAHEPERAAEEVRAILEGARKAMNEVRLAVRQWQEDESGLGLAALQGLVSQTAARSHLALEFQHDGCVADWPAEMSQALYRVVQEALTNIMRHAHASAATVRLEERDHQIILTVADDGRYTADTSLSPGFGLRGIMERSQALGGSCEFLRNQPHGLMLRVTLPHGVAGAVDANTRHAARATAMPV